MILDGTKVSQLVKEQVRDKVLVFNRRYKRSPFLSVILVGDDPASGIYVRSKEKTCKELGINTECIKLPQNVSQKELLEQIEKFNSSPLIDGILVQFPLPSHIDKNIVINSISPAKDVDGFHPINVGKTLLGQNSLTACTPKGILRLLDSYEICTKNKNICIVGRSNIVGKPLASMLIQRDRNATVTLCNSFTVDLKSHTEKADILVSAVGKPHLITEEMVKNDSVVIDVGINRIPDSSKKNGYRIVGDVDFENVAKKANAITPVPGGIGPMTIAMLMENTLQAACGIQGIDMIELEEY